MSGNSRIEFDQLLALSQVIRDGSFSKAARSLQVSQPSISARIAALERAIGGQLFVRGGRTLALSELGESFLPYAERTLAILHEGLETARLVGAGQRGRVTVGTIQPLCGGFLERTIERFHAGYPRVDLFVRVGHSEQVLEMLRDRLVGVGIVGGWPSDWYNPAVAVLHRVRQPLVLIVPAASPVAARPAVRLHEVIDHATPLYLIDWVRDLRSIVGEALSPAHALVEIPFEMAHRFLLCGQGSMFATEAMVSDDLAAVRLRAVKVVDMPPLYYENSVVSLRDRSLPRPATAFLDMLRAESQSLGDGDR
jgi:DNA-binding transcriptional LysR family regulator